jgi:uncharacterized protein
MMPDDELLRAVLDTNVIISGLMGVSGPPRDIIDAWLDDRFTLVTSVPLVRELTHVLAYPRIAERLRFSEAEVNSLVAVMLTQAEVVLGALTLPGVTRDPKDDAVVACAVEGAAGFVVSGDGDLLVLGVYQDIEMITPREFVGMLDEVIHGKECT